MQWGEGIPERAAEVNAPIGAFTPPTPPGVTVPAAARLFNVGKRSITRARDVPEHGDHLRIDAVGKAHQNRALCPVLMRFFFEVIPAHGYT